MTERAFQFNTATFAFEAFPDEVLILNVTEGSYFALGGSVLDSWVDLAERRPVSRLVDTIARRYGVAAETVAADLDGLIDRLVAEDILAAAAPEAGEEAPAAPDPAGAFRPHSFEKHVDMEYLMTLDPIHDVDPEQGWPNYQPKI